MEKDISLKTTANKTFATAINCMDGRTQDPVSAYMKKKFDAAYVDAITEPGPIKILAEQTDFARMSTLKERYMISVNQHGAKNACVVSHYDCAGNPVGKEVQMEQLRVALKVVRSWDSAMNVIGVWVDEHWRVEEVEE